jgi:hypothetical protein
MKFFIHASKGMKRQDYELAVLYAKSQAPDVIIPSREELKFGGILGIATRSGEILHPHESGRQWHMPEQYGYILSKVEPTDFVECGGSLGFWEVPEEILARLPQVEAQPDTVDKGLWLQDNW